MKAYREPTTTTTTNPPTHVRIAACSYVHTWAHTVFWRYLAANSLVELEAEHSLYTGGLGGGGGPRAFPYVGPCFSIPPPESLCYEPFMALSRRYMFLLMLWDLGWVGVGQAGGLGRPVWQVWWVCVKSMRQGPSLCFQVHSAKHTVCPFSPLPCKAMVRRLGGNQAGAC